MRDRDDSVTDDPAIEDPWAVDYENIDELDEYGERRRGRGCAWFWLVSFVLGIVLVSLPVLRALPSSEEDADPQEAARDARHYVAQQFTADALERRSTSRAARWAAPALYQQVDAVVGFLQTRDPAQLAGTEASVASCGARADADGECFHAWLSSPGQPEVIRVRFDVAIIDGRARIVRLEIVQTIQSPVPAVAGVPANPSPHSASGSA